jgi:hypothetical protein
VLMAAIGVRATFFGGYTVDAFRESGDGVNGLRALHRLSPADNSTSADRSRGWDGRGWNSKPVGTRWAYRLSRSLQPEHPKRSASRDSPPVHPLLKPENEDPLVHNTDPPHGRWRSSQHHPQRVVSMLIGPREFQYAFLLPHTGV